jgi:murein DD-endopeptidase MepM/ murein hydrolase activator NlpD
MHPLILPFGRSFCYSADWKNINLFMKIKSMRIMSQKFLSQKPGNGFLPQIALLTGFSLFGVVAAFGIAPDSITQSIEIKPVIAELELPTFRPNEAEEDQSYSYQDKVERGDTVARLLARLNVDDPDALHFLQTDMTARAIFQLKPGKIVRTTTTEVGKLLSLRYFNQAGSVLVIEHIGKQFLAINKSLSEVPRLVFKTGIVRNSLFGATDSAGIPDAVASQIAKIFSTDIDFHADLRQGDRFSVVYEVYQDADEPARSGRVLAAEFVNNGNAHHAIFFETTPGQGDYYTPEGKNLRKAFLRSPLEFSRVTSGFSMARFHPVLRNWRAHTGVDFAAPTGTRVLATADGFVNFAGTQRGYGNAIELKHQGEYTTLYAHLSGFASGLRKGISVRQGEVIGYVGSTGLATGPHLHYEFKIAGTHRDPLGVGVPFAVPLPQQHIAAFHQKTSALQAKLALIRDSKFSNFE